MALLLPSILNNTTRPNQPFVLVQSSTSHSCLPLLQNVIISSLKRKNTPVYLFCFLYSPASFTPTLNHDQKPESLNVFDWTHRIPGYDNSGSTSLDDLVNSMKDVESEGPIDICIDSLDTLLSDVGSQSLVHNMLAKLLADIRAKSPYSRLIVHVNAPCPLIASLSETRFSPTLVHLTAHPPIVLSHLATAYLTSPPPLSPPEKFWNIFTPFVERHYETESLVYGNGAEGYGGDEIVVEVLIRGSSDRGIGAGAGKKRAVEKVLEGWKTLSGVPCELIELESLKHLWSKKSFGSESGAPDPTQNVTFNLQLTTEQQESRAKVPLPYAHEGNPGVSTQPAAILYDPDSADDIDDDDPDEDLDL